MLSVCRLAVVVSKKNAKSFYINGNEIRFQFNFNETQEKFIYFYNIIVSTHPLHDI